MLLFLHKKRIIASKRMDLLNKMKALSKKEMLFVKKTWRFRNK